VTDDSAFKKQVRTRMAETGENYTVARRAVIAARDPGQPEVDRLRDELEELTDKPVLLDILEDRDHPQKRRKNAESGHTAG
jgi:hypothetical protein